MRIILSQNYYLHQPVSSQTAWMCIMLPARYKAMITCNVLITAVTLDPYCDIQVLNVGNSS